MACRLSRTLFPLVSASRTPLSAGGFYFVYGGVYGVSGRLQVKIRFLLVMVLAALVTCLLALIYVVDFVLRFRDFLNV